MFIDDTRMEEKLQIDLTITLVCELVSYDSQDVLGSHDVDALGDLLEGRLTSKSDVIGKEDIHGSRRGEYWGLTRYFNFGYDNGDVHNIKNMVYSGESCGVPGYIWVNRVPGNIDLWTYSHVTCSVPCVKRRKTSTSLTMWIMCLLAWALSSLS